MESMRFGYSLNCTPTGEHAMGDEWHDLLSRVVPTKAVPAEDSKTGNKPMKDESDVDFETFIAETCDDVYGDLVDFKQARDRKDKTWSAIGRH